ncbi:hypothetical protein BC831DRAFT_16833 [Entophlyctis helioformis]|nr:hypothetical protein BC831DRAFT_16833 [Entophlyctis helioformis]
MSREQAKELVQSLFDEADAAKAAAAKATAPRPSAAKRGRQTSVASSTEDAASSPTQPKRARRKSTAPNPSSADLDTTLPAPSNKRGQSGSSSATDKSGATKKARGKKPAAKDAAGKKSAVVTPPALHKLVAIIRNMSLSTVGRFKQLRDLAGRESIKLCPQAASRDPFVLITETVLFWAVMGLKRDRTSKSQDPVLRALRTELLAAIKPGWLLKSLTGKTRSLHCPMTRSTRRSVQVTSCASWIFCFRVLPPIHGAIKRQHRPSCRLMRPTPRQRRPSPRPLTRPQPSKEQPHDFRSG